MRWTLTMLFDDAALPTTDESGNYFGSVVDCSNMDFDEIADLAYDAVAATLEDRVDLDDVTIALITSERFENPAWVHGKSYSATGVWGKSIDTDIPIQFGTSPSSLCSHFSGGPDTLAQLERQWVDAARESLNTPSGVEHALHLLKGVQSLRKNLFPGTQCFSVYSNQPGPYDCRRIFKDLRTDRTGGRLMLIKMTIRE
jgi:hypothetical protein